VRECVKGRKNARGNAEKWRKWQYVSGGGITVLWVAISTTVRVAGIRVPRGRPKDKG